MINCETITNYLENLKPDNALAQVTTTREISMIMQKLIGFSDRFNASRRLHLMKEETTQLKNEVAGLQQVIGEMSREQDEQRIIKEQLEQLRAQHQQLCNLEKQRNEIQQLQQLLKDKDLTALQQELKQWQQEHQGDITDLNNTLGELHTLFSGLQSDFLKETKELWASIQDKRRSIDTNLGESVAEIGEETAKLTTLTTQYSSELDMAVKAYTEAHTHLTAIKGKLTEIRDQHSKNITIYQQHFEKNQAIYGALGKRHQLDSHMKTLFDQVGEKLSQFDREIKILVEKADKMTIY